MKDEFSRFVIELIETFVSSLVVILVLYMWVALPEQVWGASMEPNFYTGERVLVEKVSKRIKDYERGDVVILHPPNNESIDYIKRVVGLPGEMVKIYNCQIYISKEGKTFVLDEPYIRNSECTGGGPKVREGRFVQVGEAEYFVLGDNRDNSADSRFFGNVSKDMILGKAVLRFWPLNKVGFI
ncbi:MAG TPA: signal peptidase I [Patescibacteria group bacterium]|nr:signal peptidase I [Patescibacteria group bacterium]